MPFRVGAGEDCGLGRRSGAKARVCGEGFIVRAEARTYLRDKGSGEGNDKSKGSGKGNDKRKG